jgi:hypothetical protein
MKRQRREMVKKEEMIDQGKVVKVTKRKRQGPVPMNSLELIILYLMKSLVWW